MKKKSNWKEARETMEQIEEITSALLAQNEIKITSREFKIIFRESPNDFFKCPCCEHEERNKVDFVEFVHASELNCPVENNNILYIPYHIWNDDE